jgi:hypothetical protein
MGQRKQDQYLYQWATLIVDTYEQTAIRRGDRVGALVAAKGPLTATEEALSGAKKILTSFQKQGRQPVSGSTSTDPIEFSTTSESGEVDLTGCKDVLDPEADFDGLDLTTPSLGVEAEIDTVALAVQQWNGVAEQLGLDDLDIDLTKFQEYLDECLNCDFQIDFDWQLQPINLLDPLNTLLDDIELAIDGFASRLSPFNLLSDLCGLLDGFRFACIPDLLKLLLALQMLLKKYVTGSLQIRLDWTAIVGMLLKGILDALVSFLQEISLMLLAPLDCAITALESTEALLSTSVKTANVAIAAGQTLGDTLQGIPGYAGNLDYGVSEYFQVKKEEGERAWGYQDEEGNSKGFQSLFTQQNNSLFDVRTARADADDEGAIPMGFQLESTDTLSNRLSDPTFKYASPLQQAIMAVRDAREYISTLFDNILYSFKSLNKFMSGSISLQLSNSGTIMLILDLIALMKMLIKLVGHGSPDDWCAMLNSNPELLRGYLENSYPEVVVTPADDRVRIVAGPWDTTILTDAGCASQRDDTANSLVAQWVADLEKGMS